MAQLKIEKQEGSFPFQIYPMGDAAVTIQFENMISPQLHRQLLSLGTGIDRKPIRGLIEWVIAYSSLTIYYDPWVLGNKGATDPYETLREYLLNLTETTDHTAAPQSRLLEIPVCYEGDFGPDLELVASHHSLTTTEVIQLHSKAEYLVYMMGFAPGFPYLGGMDERIATPRRQSPRSRIPAGSVGIAGKQTGIYSLETPGGWQLIGRTPISLFNPLKEPPALLKAGDRLRFVAISAERFLEIKEGNDEPSH